MTGGKFIRRSRALFGGGDSWHAWSGHENLPEAEQQGNPITGFPVNQMARKLQRPRPAAYSFSRFSRLQSLSPFRRGREDFQPGA
jgi:hypothetical protein